MGKEGTDPKADKFLNLLNEYRFCLIAKTDRVSSKQVNEVRTVLEGHAKIVTDVNNALLIKAIRGYIPKNPKLESLLPHITGHVGFIFTSENPADIYKKVSDIKRSVPATAGAIAPHDVILPPHDTGMGPENEPFFQALGIPTETSGDTIEILQDFHLLKIDEKIDTSKAELLNMLDMPLSYGFIVRQVFYNGSVYPVEAVWNVAIHNDFSTKDSGYPARLNSVASL